MSMDEAGKFACQSCGQKYAWKPQLAGKKVKCKCGAAFAVPRQPPGAPEIQAPDEFDLASFGGDEPITPPSYAPPVTTSAAAPGRAVAAPARKAPAPRAAGSGRGKYDDDAGKKQEVRKMLMIGAGVVVLIGLVIGGRYAFQSMSSAPAQNLPGRDGRVAEMTKEDGATEALQWLKEGKQRGVFALLWTREKTEAKVQEWYDNGAKKVLAFGSVMTSSLAIELPKEKEKREYFFAWAERYRQENFPGHDEQKDVGQKYLLINFR